MGGSEKAHQKSGMVAGEMGSQAALATAAAASSSSSYLSSLSLVALVSSSSSLKSPLLPLIANFTCSLKKAKNHHVLKLQRARTRATLEEKDQSYPAPSLLAQEEEEEQPRISKDVEESVKLLKNAAKTRKVAAVEVLSAFSVIEKAKIDPSRFLEILGGSKSPGRTWMLIFTAEKQLKGGRYFPLTAVQRFDAAAKRIENGVYLGPLGCLTFEGGFSWKNRILAFIFELIRIKIGPFNPFEISLGKKEDREPSTNDPFFIWFYVDEEIAVARGRSGGTAFWCRCRRVTL